MPKTRFSKAVLQQHLQARMTHVQQRYGFDPSNGWAQIPAIIEDTKKDETAISVSRGYGYFAEIRTCATEFDIPLDFIPDGYIRKDVYFEGSTYHRYVPNK